MVISKYLIMTIHIFLVLILLVLCSSAMTAEDTSQPERIFNFAGKGALVEATAVKKEAEKPGKGWGGTWFTFKVDYIYYYGAIKPSGTFRYYISTRDAEAFSHLPSHNIKIGEKGIWYLSWHTQKNHHVPSPGKKFGVSWPIFEKSEQYIHAKTIAKTLESFREYNYKQQFDTLKKMSLSHTPRLCVFAVNSIHGYIETPKERTKFLTQLMDNPKLILKGQLELDEILIDIHKDKWKKSPKRLDFFRKWVKSECDEDAASIIYHKVVSTETYTRLNKSTLFELTSSIFNNPSTSRKTRRYLIDNIAALYKNNKRNDEVFSFIISQIRDTNKYNIVTDAIRSLKYCLPLNGKHQKVIFMLKEDSINKDLEKKFARLLEYSKKPFDHTGKTVTSPKKMQREEAEPKQ